MFRLLPLLVLILAGPSLSGCAYSKISAQLNSPLGQAAKSGDRGQIYAALAADVNVQSADPRGRELVVAILQSRKPDALRLIEEGADPNASVTGSLWGMYDGYTPLMFAAWADDLELVKALAAKGGDLKATTAGGSSPAACATSVPMMKYMLDQGVSVDHAGAKGVTLLANAAARGSHALARLLLSRGADPDRAREHFQKTIKFLQADPSIANHPTILSSVRSQNEAIALIDRVASEVLAAKSAPAAPAAGGVTKAELAQMMREAAAETARQAAPAPAPAAPSYKSDVDQPAYKATENPDAYAIVVGVEKYNALPDAKFAERDAKAMSAHLVAMGYPQRNVVTLTGAQATRTGLVKNLEAWLPNNVTERSTVLFYFSGHGAPDAKTSQAYLVPTDGDPQYLEETAYPIKRLYAKLGALKAKRVLVALDSCFSGAGGRSVLAQGTRPLVAKLDLNPGEDKIVSLSASSAEEITGALEEQGHGLFTYHLLKSLAETAGRGTVAEVYAGLKPRVQDEARRQNRAQTPQAFGRTLDGGLR